MEVRFNLITLTRDQNNAILILSTNDKVLSLPNSTLTDEAGLEETMLSLTANRIYLAPRWFQLEYAGVYKRGPALDIFFSASVPNDTTVNGFWVGREVWQLSDTLEILQKALERA